MKLKQVALAGFLFAGLAATSCKKDNDNNMALSDTDRDYMLRTSVSNNAEVNAANLALGKATNPAVKAYAQRMITEHGMAQTDLKNLGATVGYPVKDTLDPAHVTLSAQLSAMSGTQFDSAYIHTQVLDHQLTVNNFQTEINNGQHQDVKNYANTYLPHIQMHLQSADSIATAYFR